MPDTTADRNKAERLQKEAELHDKLRGEAKDDAYYLSNKKWYSVASSNVGYVQNWIRARAKGGGKILDFCCGNGENAIFAASVGAQAWGIDISPVSIENCRAEAKKAGVGDRANFEVGDAENTPFPDAFFDGIVVNGVLHHLDLNKSYPELARILKPTGEVICTEALRHNIIFHTYRKLTPHLRSEWEVAHILGRSDIIKARKYFDHVKVARFFHLATIAAVPFRNMPGFSILRKSLELVDRVLLSIPGLRWQAWMAVFILGRPVPGVNSSIQLAKERTQPRKGEN